MPRDYKIMWQESMDKVKSQRIQLSKQKESIECMGESLMSSVEEKGKYTT